MVLLVRYLQLVLLDLLILLVLEVLVVLLDLLAPDCLGFRYFQEHQYLPEVRMVLVGHYYQGYLKVLLALVDHWDPLVLDFLWVL